MEWVPYVLFVPMLVLELWLWLGMVYTICVKGDVVDYEIKDSGETRTFDTGAVRDSGKGKGRFDLIPPETEHALALHFGHGAEKKGDRNWEKGMPLGCYLDSARRHLNKWQRGERDENHLIAAVWNLVCLYATAERVKAGRLPRSLDDNGYLAGDLIDAGFVKWPSPPAPETEEPPAEGEGDQGCTCSSPTCLLKKREAREPAKDCPYSHVFPDPEPAPMPEEVRRRNVLDEAKDAALYVFRNGPVSILQFHQEMGKRGFDAFERIEAREAIGGVRWWPEENGIGMCGTREQALEALGVQP